LLEFALCLFELLLDLLDRRSDRSRRSIGAGGRSRGDGASRGRSFELLEIPLLYCILDPFLIRLGIRILRIRIHRHVHEACGSFEIAPLEELIRHLQEIACSLAAFLSLGVVYLGCCDTGPCNVTGLSRHRTEELFVRSEIE
jgi:hypothetical protein